jgi:4-oxalocrotonate tautomerase
MPHIIAKIRDGYSQAQKERLAAALSRAIVETLDCPQFDVSVGIEGVRQNDWTERVYGPDIRDKAATIFQQPGYAPAEG